MSKDNWGFHPQYVQPFYMKLGYTMFKMDEKELSEFLIQIKSVLNQLDHNAVMNLLTKGNWRSRRSIGWFIGFAKWDQYTDAIGKTMIQHPDHAMMFCFALARFGTREASDWLVKYLEKYLSDVYANNFDADNITTNDWVLVTLEYLDSLHGTNHSDRFYPKKWEIFFDTFLNLFAHFESDNIAPPWNLDVTRDQLDKIIKFTEHHFD